jgi:hypothetical protein
VPVTGVSAPSHGLLKSRARYFPITACVICRAGIGGFSVGRLEEEATERGLNYCWCACHPRRMGYQQVGAGAGQASRAGPAAALSPPASG